MQYISILFMSEYINDLSPGKEGFMKKVIICILILAYASGILTILCGHIFQPLSTHLETETPDYFEDEVIHYPWVQAAMTHKDTEDLLYYKHISYLRSVDQRIGSNLLYVSWIKDTITPEEGQVIHMLVELSEKNPEIALHITQSTWFRKGIGVEEVALIEEITTLSEEKTFLTENITSSNWFIFNRREKVEDMVKTMVNMPSDLSLIISFSPWFTSEISLSESTLIEELVTLYAHDQNLALTLPPLMHLHDLPALEHLNDLYETDTVLVKMVFDHGLSRENLLLISDLAQIAHYNTSCAHTLAETLSVVSRKKISSLGALYSVDQELGEFANIHFGESTAALRYLEKVIEVEVFPQDQLSATAVFISENPEYSIEDRLESYRYHLLTHILQVFPVETAQEYENLICVICSVYGNRFYSWKNGEYTTQNGLSFDGILDEEERDAVIELLTFFIDHNEQSHFPVDLREVSREYLFGVVDIPFTHVIKTDSLYEAVHAQQGTAFVTATIANIHALEERFEQLQDSLYDLSQIEYSYSNPLVKLIMEEGTRSDRIFLYLCDKNWEQGACIDHTLHTRMDCIVMGISTTSMYWTAPESAHIYPAYIPSDVIQDTMEGNEQSFGNPFMYKGFIAPYDEAGFEDFLDRHIVCVELYDPYLEEKIILFEEPERSILYDVKIQILIGVSVFCVMGLAWKGIRTYT